MRLLTQIMFYNRCQKYGTLRKPECRVDLTPPRVLLSHTSITPQKKMGPIRTRKTILTVAFEDRTGYRHPNTNLHKNKNKNKNCQSPTLFILYFCTGFYEEDRYLFHLDGRTQREGSSPAPALEGALGRGRRVGEREVAPLS